MIALYTLAACAACLALGALCGALLFWLDLRHYRSRHDKE